MHISLHLLTLGLLSSDNNSGLTVSLGHQDFDLSSEYSFEDPSFALLGFDLSSRVMQGGSNITEALQFSFVLHSFCLSSIPVEGASETTGTFSLGLQGFDFSSVRMGGASSTEKQGRQVVAVGLAHDLPGAPSFVGGPGVFEGGTLPNIFAVIAGRLSSLNRDGGSPLRAALHGLYQSCGWPRCVVRCVGFKGTWPPTLDQEDTRGDELRPRGDGPASQG